ncbi:MAG: hypothetical protein ABSH34_29170 [Verrucomicrobiota bacterium]|jgi:hypothetical protein
MALTNSDQLYYQPAPVSTPDSALQTLIVPVAALANREKSPLRVLEGLAGRPLAAR